MSARSAAANNTMRNPLSILHLVNAFGTCCNMFMSTGFFRRNHVASFRAIKETPRFPVIARLSGAYTATNEGIPFNRAMEHLHRIVSRFEYCILEGSPILLLESLDSRSNASDQVAHQATPHLFPFPSSLNFLCLYLPGSCLLSVATFPHFRQPCLYF